MRVLFVMLMMSIMLLNLHGFDMERTIMLFVHGKNIKLTEIQLMNIRSGVEEIATRNGLLLVEESMQEEVLKEQSNMRKKGCYDDSCVVDAGKMLSAKKLLKIDVMKGNKSYIFNVSFVDLEKGVKERTKKGMYEGDLNDDKELSTFVNSLSIQLIEEESLDKVNRIIEEKKEIRTIEQKEKQEKRYKIQFVTIPSGVQVFDENKNFLGITPLNLNLNRGFQKIKFEKEGYEIVEREIDIIEDKQISVKLNEKKFEINKDKIIKEDIIAINKEGMNYNNKKDYNKANELYKKACDLGNGAGCFNLGVNYSNGNGVSKDLNKANEYYKKACDLGERNGCYHLGYNYKKGKGVSKDMNNGIEYLRKACLLNMIYACTLLENIYIKGDGVSKNIKKANEYYKKACEIDSMYCNIK